ESARSARCGLTRAILERTCSNRAATPKQVMVSFTERSFDDPDVMPMLGDRHDPAAPAAREAGGQYLDILNAEQREAVEHDCDESQGDGRPLLIIAGAGSGKTNTLAYRVAHLVYRGADPGRILLLTFSRRAAAEMERRAG